MLTIKRSHFALQILRLSMSMYAIQIVNDFVDINIYQLLYVISSIHLKLYKMVNITFKKTKDLNTAVNRTHFHDLLTF